MLCQIAGHGQGHACNACLGRAVGLLTDLAVESGDAGGEHHGTAFTVFHGIELAAGGGEQACGVVGADQVHVDNAGEIFQRSGVAVAPDHAGISPVTRAKVFQLAAEIGYTHLESRTPSAKKKTDQFNFSVLICSEKDEYFHGDYESPGEQILAGVSEYAQIIGARMDVNLISPAVTSLDDPAFGAIDMLKARRNTGVLLIYPFPGPIIDQLSLRLPLVSLVDQPEPIMAVHEVP